MLKVRVKKSKWWRGKMTIDKSYLLHPTKDKMCCIGFLGKELGLREGDMCGVATLAEVIANKVSEFCDCHNNALEDAYGINDNLEISDVERIKELRKIGKEMGVKFVFVP